MSTAEANQSTATLLAEKFAKVHEAYHAGASERFWKVELATVNYYRLLSSLKKDEQPDAVKSAGEGYQRDLDTAHSESQQAAKASVMDFLTAVQQALPDLSDDFNLQYALGQALMQLAVLTYTHSGATAPRE